MTEAIDTMFEEAVEALRQNEKARAKDILTRLIRADQKNATYWIWMSAAVETRKERVYCLETALKLEPENSLAERGLILMGALPPDPNPRPFPLNRTPAWEDKLLLDHERPRMRGLGAFMSNPATRLAATVLAGAVLLSAVLLAFLNPRTVLLRGTFVTPGPSPTYTATPTFMNVRPLVVTPGNPTPLAVLLGISYTPTPVYVNTPRAPIGVDFYRAAQASLARGDWAAYLQEMDHIQEIEPEAADIKFQIAEAYRLAGECRDALLYYDESLKVDSAFAPAHLGLARARLCSEPAANVLSLLDLAQKSDPAYGEVFLERANFHMRRKDFEDALGDLAQAERLMPRSALVQLAYAEAYTLQGNPGQALSSARKANTLDQTLLPAYYYLGRAYVESGQYAEAIEPLQLYLIYEPEDGDAYALLGEALAEMEDYRAAVETLNSGLRLTPNHVSSFVHLGTSYLRLDNLAGAEVNFKRAIEYFPDSFEANIGLTEIYYRKKTFGSAYLQSETSLSRADTSTERALAIYWRALAQEGRESFGDAIQDWRTLLSMPNDSMTAEMRKEAQEHLKNIATPTYTSKAVTPSPTLTLTPTNRPGNTATPPPAVKSPTPTRTPTATKTP